MAMSFTVVIFLFKHSPYVLITPRRWFCMDALLSGFTTINNITFTAAFIAHPFSQEDILDLTRSSTVFINFKFPIQISALKLKRVCKRMRR